MGPGSVWSCSDSGLLPPGRAWPGLVPVLSSQLLLLEIDLALGVAGRGRESHGLAFST